MRSGPGAARTILLFHIISARPSKQPLMVRNFLKVYMELGSYFLFLQEPVQDIIIIRNPDRMECTKHNIWIGGVRYAQEDSWAVKLTFISHVHLRHPWRIR